MFVPHDDAFLTGYNRLFRAAAMGPSVVAEVKALEVFVDRHCRPIIGNITHAHSPRTHRLTLLSAQISVHKERVPR